MSGRFDATLTRLIEVDPSGIHERVRRMRESSGYQIILEEGMAKGVEIGKLKHARSILLRLAAKTWDKLHPRQ